jgi:hypothetical protein
MKRLRGGQPTGTIPPKSGWTLYFEIFVTYVMFPVILIRITMDFLQGSTVMAVTLLSSLLICIFIVYVTTLGVAYINKAEGYTILKVILGIIMLYNSQLFFSATFGILTIFILSLIRILPL